MEKSVFLVNVEGEDAMLVTVVDDVNRPNNMDVHSVLEKWVTENFGFKEYDYWDIETCDKYNI